MTSSAEPRKYTLGVFYIFSAALVLATSHVGFLYYPVYPKETIYFIFILSTLGVTGFLSFFAWQQRNIRGALPFMVMELCECILALFEIVSILSHTAAQALFWFNLRFLLIAIIPVAWLVFTLAFSGQTRLLSKTWLAGMLAIPLLTQLMLWSNALHGLWVKQEVGFHLTGPFWIVDTSARVPAVWFMVHNFYSIILILVGTILLLQVAWGKRKAYRGQALLLSTGVMIALVTSLFPIFNLLPHLEFNPFVPGMGISALFYALAIFRFQFLKRTSTREFTAPIPNLESQSNRYIVLLGFIFVLMATGLSTTGYISYQNYEKQFRTQVENQLTAIAELKINELTDWRSERLGDAEVLYENPLFAELAKHALTDPANTQAQAQMQAWLESIQKSYQYDRVYLVDTQAVERFSAPNSPEPLAPHLQQDIADVLRSRQITFLDMYRDSDTNSVHLAILIPLLADAESSSPLGVLILRINPEKYLYPFIEEWPADSLTAETLLIRRDGNEVLFLNDVKFQPNAALNLRISLEETNIPAVQAILGQTGIVEGTDYRSVPVLAYLHPVPNSPWFLVAKIDTAEVFAPLQKRAWDTFFLFGALISSATAGLAVLWRQQRVRFYRAQYQTAESLRRSEENYRELIELASDGIFIADAGTKFIEVNQSGCDMLGYTRAELLTMRIIDLLAPEDAAATPPRLEELRQGKTLITERRLMRKDGSLLSAEISSRMFPDGRFQSIVRDITERKRVAAALEQYAGRLEEAESHASLGSWEFHVTTGQGWWSKQMYQMFDLPISETVPDFETYLERVHPDDRGIIQDVLAKMSQGEEPQCHEFRNNPAYGPLRHFLPTVYTERDAQGKPTKFIGTQLDITARKLAEIAIKDSEERFRSLVEQSMDGVVLIDEQGIIIEWNQAQAKITGIPQDQALGALAWDVQYQITPPEWRTQHNPEYMKAGFFKSLHTGLSEKTGTFREVRIRSASGEDKIIQQASFMVKGEKSNRVGAIVRDVTEYKQAEEALLESKERFEGLFENTPIGVLLADPQGNILEVNPAALHILGSPSAEATRAINLLTFQPLIDVGVVNDFLECVRIAQPLTTEHAYTTNWGKSIELNLRFTPFAEVDGEIRFLQLLLEDVTERRHAEEQINRQIRRLNSLRVVDTAISSSFDIHVTLDIVLHQVLAQLEVDAAAVLLINPQLPIVEYVASQGFRSQTLQHTQLHLDEGYAGRAIRERQTIHIRDLLGAGGSLAEALQLAGEDFIEYFGIPLMAKAEIKGVLEIYHRAALNPDSEWLNFLGALANQAAIAIDNAQLFEHLQRANAELEQRVAERTEELNQTNLQLEHANRTKDEFLATMSHELRTPLNSILGLSETLLEQIRDPLSAHQQRSLQTIAASGEHLLALINDILDLSKIEAGKFDYYPQTLDINDMCRSSLVFVKEQATRKSITLKYEPDKTVSKIFADPRRLKQILVNLLTNAVKFTPNHGQVTLQVCASAENDRIQFSVTDTGIGIAHKDLQRLFVPFVQVDSGLTREYEGTGLGLALVQKLTDLHGGSVAVESEVGKGSCFTINLPLGQTGAEQKLAGESGNNLLTGSQAELQNASVSTPVEHQLILLAEDNMANILTIGDYLESHSYQVVVAHDGLEAIEKAVAVQPSVVLMDIQMPVLDGLEAIRRLRVMPSFESMPIIAFTALAMPGDRERCLEAGANEYVSKPASLKHLIKLIDGLTKQSK